MGISIRSIDKRKGSGLIFILVITSIIVLGINQYTPLIWQQKKIINLEYDRLRDTKAQKLLLTYVVSELKKYQKIGELPSVFSLENKLGSASLVQVLLENGHYAVYKIDLSGNAKYPSKLHIYIAVCEYGNKVRVLPISNILAI